MRDEEKTEGKERSVAEKGKSVEEVTWLYRREQRRKVQMFQAESQISRSQMSKWGQTKWKPGQVEAGCERV